MGERGRGRDPGCSLERPRPLTHMAETRPPRDDTSANDPSRRAPPAGEAVSVADAPGPAQRVQRLRLGVRAVWWSAVVLTLVFAGLALWLAIGRRDPFALFFAILAACCAVAGYGTLLAVRRPSAS